jgi:hypothetical protein
METPMVLYRYGVVMNALEALIIVSMELNIRLLMAWKNGGLFGWEDAQVLSGAAQLSRDSEWRHAWRRNALL